MSLSRGASRQPTRPASLSEPTRPEPSGDAMEQAAEWFALLRSGVATAADQARWRAWLEAAQAHREAWSFVERISLRFEPIQASSGRGAAVTAFREAASDRLRRRRVLLGLAAGVGVGVLGSTAWRAGMLPEAVLAWAADQATSTGEIRRLALPDGTTVWLNANSAFNQESGPDLSRLRLLSGEILVATAPRATSRLVVETPQGSLRPLGTRFAVRLDADTTLVAVFEGAVEVAPAGGAPAQVVPAGRQLRFTAQAPGALENADPGREAWVRGLLVAQDMPLGEVVSELRRYHRGYLSVAPEVAGLRVFGSYPATDPDRALAMLESVMPIRVQRVLPWWVRVQPAAASAPP